jgi:hypothetical protein
VYRVIRPLAAAAIGLAGLPLLSAAGAPSSDDLGACRATGQIHVRDDEWTEIKAPKADGNAGEGAQTVVDFAAPPLVHSRIYATNGTVIKVSADAGCTWSTMGNTAQLDKVDSKQTRQDVYTNLAAPANGSLWAASYDDVGGVAHPHVYAALGLGDDNLTNPTFTDVSSGLPQAGKPVALVGSLSTANVMYLLVEGPAPDPTSGDLTTPARHLYATYAPQVDPGGPVPPVAGQLPLVWKEVALPAGFSHLAGVEPAASGHGVWIWSGTSYATTTDPLANQVSWTTTQLPGRVTSISTDVRGTTHLVYAADQGGADRRYDDGSLTRFTTGGVPTAGLYASGSFPGVAAVSGPGGVFGYDVRVRRWVRITPKGVPALTKLTMPFGRLNRVVLGLAGGTLYRYDTYPGELFLQPPRLDGLGDWPTLPGGVKVPVLTPVKEVVTVTPGELHTVPVDFRVPPAPNPLDVYFLLDTTGSMQPAVDGLKESINKIAFKMRKALGKDACFGLGEFKDFWPYDTQHTYTRDIPITCDHPVEKIHSFMADTMRPAAGGADIPEAQTIALTQSVTGKGQQPPDPPVTPGQQAGFRADAYKVIVLISDSSFKQASGYPTRAAAINTLNVADVKVVNVLVSTDEGDHDAALADMQELAAGTSTVAPAQGVDCDGNGRQSAGDLTPGAPLVCDVGGSGAQINVGPAIVGLLLGVIDPGTLAVDIRDTDRAVTQPIQGRTSRVVNLKMANALAFAMPVSCSKAQDGQDLPIGLLPTVRALPVMLHGRVLYGQVIVRCRSIPPAPLPKVQQPPPPPDDPVLPVPAKPQPVALVQPPVPPAQPLANMNMNAGFSSQEEQQFQLAAVGQDAGEQQEQVEGAEELAMSDYRHRDSAAGATMLGGALMMSAAAGVAYRRRLQRAQQVRTVRA